MATPLLVDTDPGIDDALALLAAWNSPEVVVEVVTTVAGNVTVEQATTNVCRLLALRKPDPAPVVAIGAPDPLARQLVTATRYHGADGLGDLDDWPAVGRGDLAAAVPLILDRARRRADHRVQRPRVPHRPRGRRAGHGAARPAGRRARDRSDARPVGGGAARDRARGRDPARARRPELPGRQGDRHDAVPPHVPRSAMPAAPPPRVLVVGSANVDFTVAAARLPRPGGTCRGGTLLVNHGGKGANQAVAARRLGAEVRFVGCVGDDASGREIGAALGREGIGVAGVTATDAAATGAALIVVDAEGRNQTGVAPGADGQP